MVSWRFRAEVMILVDFLVLSLKSSSYDLVAYIYTKNHPFRILECSCYHIDSIGKQREKIVTKDDDHIHCCKWVSESTIGMNSSYSPPNLGLSHFLSIIQNHTWKAIMKYPSYLNDYCQ